MVYDKGSTLKWTSKSFLLQGWTLCSKLDTILCLISEQIGIREELCDDLKRNDNLHFSPLISFVPPLFLKFEIQDS